MDILNELILKNKSFEILGIILKKHYLNKKELKPIISYDEFKETIKTFIEKIMGTFLEDTDYYDDKYSCTCKQMRLSRRGEFSPENNEITINEDVIKELYHGNLNEMTTIFHELNHFKIKYELRLGKINQDLVRIVKEQLLRKSSSDPFDEKNTIKKGATYINDDYYKCNYRVFSEEKVAEINAIRNLIFFLKTANIELSEFDMHELETRITNNNRQYENYLRDLRYNINFNSYFLDFEEAFDIMIIYNPNWLKCPQLDIEYYQDENGKVKKRTIEQLQEMLYNETDEEKKQYINQLLTSNNHKHLSKLELLSNDTGLKIKPDLNEISNESISKKF